MATNAQLGEYYVDKSGHMVKNKIVKIGNIITAMVRTEDL